MISDDANTVRRYLGITGSREGTPAMEALARLEAKAGMYEWVRPIITGEDDARANERAAALGSALLRGFKGEAALVVAAHP